MRILGHFESCHWQANLVRFQVSSIIKCCRCHENRSIVLLQNRRRKRHKTFKIHLPTAEQYLHQVNIMLLELDLRMLLYFFSENYRVCQNNVWITVHFYKTDPFSPHCAIMRFFRWLCDRMRQEVNCAKSHQRIISESLFIWHLLFQNWITGWMKEKICIVRKFKKK